MCPRLTKERAVGRVSSREKPSHFEQASDRESAEICCQRRTGIAKTTSSQADNGRRGIEPKELGRERSGVEVT
jgi:hypothetical protein